MEGISANLGVSAKIFFLDVRFSCFLGVFLSKFAVENGYDHFFGLKLIRKIFVANYCGTDSMKL